MAANIKSVLTGADGCCRCLSVLRYHVRNCRLACRQQAQTSDLLHLPPWTEHS